MFINGSISFFGCQSYGCYQADVESNQINDNSFGAVFKHQTENFVNKIQGLTLFLNQSSDVSNDNIDSIDKANEEISFLAENHFNDDLSNHCAMSGKFGFNQVIAAA